MYRVTMHFTDGNPVELLAEKPEIPIGAREEEGGLHKHVFTAPGGDPMPVYFDPGKLNAISVVFTDEWRRMPEVSGEVHEAMGEPRFLPGVPESVEDRSVSRNVGDPSGNDRPRPMMDVLNFLSRFVVATVNQLDRVRMERSFRAGRLRWGSETKRFPLVGSLTRERLEAMRQDGLIRIDDPFYIRQNESVCVATDRGMARVGLGDLPPVEPEDLAHGYQQFLRTVDLYLAVMHGTRENAAWITSRELMSDEIRTSRENELGRSLPASIPSAHKVWPATPEGVLVLKERNVVAALFGSVPAGWECTTLGEACSRGGGNIQTGPFGSQLHASDYVPWGIPSIMPQNIGDNRVSEDGIARITADDAERLSRYLVRTGDIVYSRRGDVEKRALIRSSEDGWLCGTGCLRVRFGTHSEDPSYASYYLGHPDARAWIVRHAQGATMPNLNTSILSSLPFVVPPIEEQRAIAHILGTLDDKIELNRRMNETLEEMARAIFKSWFVDFDPVRAKSEGRDPGLPKHIADLFPDRFEDSELGEIPAGWRVGTLGEVSENPRRTIKPARMDESTPYIGLEHMPRRSISLADWASSENLESNKYEFERGEILFGKLRPYFHKVGIAPVAGVCSTDILVIAAKQPEWFGFVLEHVSSEDFVNYTTATSSGTKMPRTNWKDMSGFSIVAPPSSIAKAFDTLIQPFVERIVENIHEMRNLAAARDALLSRLISGELRVEKVKKIMEETV